MYRYVDRRLSRALEPIQKLYVAMLVPSFPERMMRRRNYWATDLVDRIVQ